MKEKVKQAWARRPRLRRGHWLAVNLLLILLLLVFFWGTAGYPLPTARMEFRRLERTNLLRPAEIVLEIPEERRNTDKDVFSRGGLVHAGNVYQSEPLFVGLRNGHAISAAVGGKFSGRQEYWDLEKQEEPIKLIPLISFFHDWRIDRASDPACGIVIPELPAETARAEMTIGTGDRIYHDVGTWEEPGAWLFGFVRKMGGYGERWIRSQHYVLELYREDGSLLLQQEGAIPWGP